MRLNFILGCGAAFLAATIGCGSSSSSGGAGGTGAVTTGVGTTTATSTKASVTATTGTKAGTTVGSGGAGGAPMVCNPVKDTQCDIAGGFACDDNGDGTFGCYNQPANTAALCATCDYKNGPACKDGMTCVTADAQGNTSKCAAFCCSDADCGGATGSCNLMVTSSATVGVCGTVSGDGGAGGNGPFLVPVCTGIPATLPSGGTCGVP